MTAARRLAIALPAAVLLAVASTQMILARRTQLSPWKGGGFGMFASVDGLPFRWVRIYVSAPEPAPSSSTGRCSWSLRPCAVSASP